MFRDTHDRQITPGDAGDQVGPAGDPEVICADPHQIFIVSKKQHQFFREKISPGKKCQRSHHGTLNTQAENISQHPDVLFAPVLSAEDCDPVGNGAENNDVDEGDLRCQRHRRHDLLVHLAQHQGVRRRHHGTQQILKGNGEGQPQKFFIVLSVPKNILKGHTAPAVFVPSEKIMP